MSAENPTPSERPVFGEAPREMFSVTVVIVR